MQVCAFSAILFPLSIAEVLGSSLKNIYRKILTSEMKKAGAVAALISEFINLIKQGRMTIIRVGGEIHQPPTQLLRSLIIT